MKSPQEEPQQEISASEAEHLLSEDKPEEQSRGKQLLRIFVLVFAMVFAIAPVTGLQGLFHAMAVRSVYSDRCPKVHSNVTNTTSSYPCDESERSIALAGNIIASVMNFSTVGGGILIDICGAYSVAWIGFVVWTLATFVAGLAPGVGILWFIGYGVQACAGCTAFYAVVLHHAKVTFPSDRAYAVAITVFTALWDGAVLMIPVLALYFTKLSTTPLWVLFGIYAAFAGLIPVIGFKCLFSPEKEGESAEGEIADTEVVTAISLRTVEDVENSNGEQIQDGAVYPEALPPQKKVVPTKKTAGAILNQQLEYAKAIVLKKAFWACTAQITMNIIVGYAVLDNVVPMAKQIGATKHASGPDIVQMITIMMGGSAVASAVPGVVLHRVGNKRGCTLLLLCCAVLIAIVPVIIFGFSKSMDPLTALYLGCGVFFVWRMISCTVVNVCLPTLIVKNDAATGTAFAVAFGVGGIIAIAVGGFVTHSLQAGKAVIPITVCLCAAAATTATVLSISICCTKASSLKDDPTATKAECACDPFKNCAELNEKCNGSASCRFEAFRKAGVYFHRDGNHSICNCMPSGCGFAGTIWAGWAKKIGTTPRLEAKETLAQGRPVYKKLVGCSIGAAFLKNTCHRQEAEEFDRENGKVARE